MRVVTPMLFQVPGVARVPALAVLESGLSQGVGPSLSDILNSPLVPGEAPSGFTDWPALIQTTGKAIGSEPDPQKAQLLKSALTIAGAALPIPVAGVIVAAAVAFLSLFGISIRGKTQHLSVPDATAQANKFCVQVLVPMIKVLPPDGRQKFFELTEAFDKAMWGLFSTWWGGRLQIDRTPLYFPTPADYSAMSEAALLSYFSTAPNIYWMYLYTILHEADVETVNDQAKPWFFDRYQSYVLKPLDQWFLSKYNETLAEYQKTGGTLLGKVLGPANVKTVAGVVAGAGLFAFLLSAMSRRRRRV